jgi:tRNA(fMet)-specific endonuclease VapC
MAGSRMVKNEFLIDSSIFIEHIRTKDKSKTTLQSFSDDLEGFVSIITIYEVYAGAITEDRKVEAKNLFANFSIILMNEDIAIKAAEIFQQLKRKNKIIGHRDIMIAATALHHNLPLKTLNKKHFDRIEELILV